MKIYTIYKAININNGKVYIGFDSNWPNRKYRHKLNYEIRNTKFYSAIKKYGWDSFEWSILFQSKDKNYTLNEMENYFITEYDSINCGYNLIPGGSQRVNFKHSEETKIKISQKLKGRKFLEDHKKNMSGKIRSEQHCINLSLSQKGKPKSSQSIEKRKNTIKNKGDYKLSEEHKAKISSSMKGRKVSIGSSKPISINGIIYRTQKEAKESLGISNRKFNKFLKTGIL
jgi:group I intron endonuclease